MDQGVVQHTDTNVQSQVWYHSAIQVPLPKWTVKCSHLIMGARATRQRFAYLKIDLILKFLDGGWPVKLQVNWKDGSKENMMTENDNFEACSCWKNHHRRRRR